MTSTIRNSLSSEPFEIFAQSGKRFFVHSDILAAQSEPLRRATMGMWKEATEKKIDLSDWDDETVGRFVEFLYFGDYQVLEATPGDMEKLGGGKGVEKTGLLGVNLLLVHAKVYALAQYKAVEELKMMALGRLKTALDDIDRHMSIRTCVFTGTENVIELLGYVYTHTDSLQSSEEPMRNLVSIFAAKNLETLMIRGEMELLLREKCDFSVELMEKVAERLRDREKKVRDMEDRIRDLESRAAKSTTDLVESKVAITEKMQQVFDNKIKLLEAANKVKIRELEVSYVEIVGKWEVKVDELRSKLSKSKSKVKSLEATYPERLAEFETFQTMRNMIRSGLNKIEDHYR